LRALVFRLGSTLLSLLAAPAFGAQISSVAKFRGELALLAVAVTWVRHGHLLHRLFRAVSSVTRASHHACASAWVSKL
jgi:hypothetical protein